MHARERKKKSQKKLPTIIVILHEFVRRGEAAQLDMYLLILTWTRISFVSERKFLLLFRKEVNMRRNVYFATRLPDERCFTAKALTM